MTGFPGFLGKRVAAGILADPGTDELVVLVQERFRPQAEAELKRLEAGREKPRSTILTGDISSLWCGLDGLGREKLRARVTKAFHLAAAYNLALPRDVGMKV